MKKRLFYIFYSLFTGLLRQSVGLQEEVYRSSPALQWAFLQIHSARERAPGGSKARSALHNSGLSRWDVSVLNQGLVLLPALTVLCRLTLALIGPQGSSDLGCWLRCLRTNDVSSSRRTAFWRRCIWTGSSGGISCRSLRPCWCLIRKPPQQMVSEERTELSKWIINRVYRQNLELHKEVLHPHWDTCWIKWELCVAWK